jgi:tetratricopeptide (TPR) repeat protein
LTAAEDLVRLVPQKCDGYALEARVLSASGNAPEAIRRLRLAASQSPDRAGCLRSLAEIAIETRSLAETDEALESLMRAPCADDRACAANFLWVASHAEQVGEMGRAFIAYKRAYERTPTDDVLQNVARLASDAGLHADALASYNLLMKRHPEDARWQKAVALEGTLVAKTAAGL